MSTRKAYVLMLDSYDNGEYYICWQNGYMVHTHDILDAWFLPFKYMAEANIEKAEKELGCKIKIVEVEMNYKTIS